MRNRILIICILLLSITSCSTVPPPNDVHNVCKIFNQYPEWRGATQRVAQQWKVPVSVQLAIIYQESSFKSTAKPPRKKLLGFIPWKRPTSAYGYCQAIDQTWNLYQKSVCRYGTKRHNFEQAAEFIGWYADRAKKRAGISPLNAYELYLAYHEGITNYMHKTYLAKPWLLQVAKKVQARANMYRAQLYLCEY